MTVTLANQVNADLLAFLTSHGSETTECPKNVEQVSA